MKTRDSFDGMKIDHYLPHIQKKETDWNAKIIEASHFMHNI